MIFRLIRWPLLIMNTMAAVALLLSYISVYFSPEQGAFMPLLGLFMPYLLIVNVLAVLFWTVVRSKYFWLSSLALLMGLPWITHSIQLNLSSRVQSDDFIHLATLNAHQYYDLKTIDMGKASAKPLEEWTSLIRRNNGLNILCIQEHVKGNLPLIPETKHLIHSHQCERRGPAIFTEFPILQKGCFDFGSSVNNAVFVDVLTANGDTIRIYNIHLQSNQIGHLTDELLRENELDEEQWAKTRQVLSRYIHTAADRVDQMEEVLEHIQASPYPVILAGDFNEGPQSYIYRKVSQQLEDAFVQKGKGFATTYAGNLPFLRIDHIFVDPQMKVQSYEVGRMHLSDHYPVVAVIQANKDAAN